MSDFLPDDHPAARVVAALEAKGFRALLAGGAVRDRLLGRPAKDYDVATAARPDEVREVFRRVVPAVLKALTDRGGNRLPAAFQAEMGKSFAPLQDVLVRAEDRPGELAGMVIALADAEVNIKDIELLKIRELTITDFQSKIVNCIFCFHL